MLVLLLSQKGIADGKQGAQAYEAIDQQPMIL